MSLATWWKQRKQRQAVQAIAGKAKPAKTSAGVVQHVVRKANSDRV